MNSESTPPVQKRSDGRPFTQGIITMVALGLGWAGAGSSVLLASWPGRIGAYVVILVVAVVVALTALKTPAGSARRGPTSANPGRDFALVNLVQSALILVAVLAFVRFRHPALIAPTVAAIVGLHFIPLARIFGIPLYRSTGLVLTVIAALAFALSTQGPSTSALIETVSFPTALTLWGTSLLLPRYR